MTRKPSLAQVLRVVRQSPMKTNAVIAICDRAWSTIRDSSAIQLRVFPMALS
jgi:hypothetical protein